MSASLPKSDAAARRPRAFAAAVIVYLAVFVAALATHASWLEALASMLLILLLLAPAIARGGFLPALSGVVAAALIGALALRGFGDVALDLTPAIVNAALAFLFARTLTRGRMPLIARAIVAIEGPDRLGLARVCGYARALTWVWAIALGTQAAAVLAIVALATPRGFIAAFGFASPLPLEGDVWRVWLHFGTYAGVLALLVVEYAFRRVYLRRVPHLPPAEFAARLVRRWPALVHGVVDETAHR